MSNSDDRLGEFDEPLAEDSTETSDGVPETTAPAVEPPRPDSPSVESPTETQTPGTRLQERYSQVDPEFRTLFWKLILLYKLGIIGLSLGLLLLVFGAHPTAGPALTLGGILFTGHALYLTRKGKAKAAAGEFDFDTEDSATNTGDTP